MPRRKPDQQTTPESDQPESEQPDFCPEGHQAAYDEAMRQQFEELMAKADEYLYVPTGEVLDESVEGEPVDDR